MRLVADVLLRADNYLNPLKDRELNLRGLKIPMIENLAVLQDQFTTIDFSDNDLKKLDNFPIMKRLTTLLCPNNAIVRISHTIHENIPNLQNLVLTNNKISNYLDIDSLSGLKLLEHLSLMENPIVYSPHYRLFTIYAIKTLKSLDFQKITQQERRNAAKLFTESAEGIAILNKIKSERVNDDNSNTSHGVSTTISSAFTPQSIAAKPAVVVLTESQKQEIRDAISSAETKEEVDRIEQQLRTGTFPFRSVSGSDNGGSEGNRGIKRGRDEDSHASGEVLVA